MAKLMSSIIVIVIASLLYSEEGKTQDVYNFYFQKNMPATLPSPTLQTSGATQATVVPPPVPETSPAPQTVASIPEQQNQSWPLKHWNFGIGYSVIDDVRGPVASAAVSLGYDFNKYIGVQGQINLFERYQVPDDMWWVTARNDEVDGALGLVLTPINLGGVVRLGAIGGVMTTREMADPKFIPNEGVANGGYHYFSQMRVAYPIFGGVLASVDITQNFSFAGNIKLYEVQLMEKKEMLKSATLMAQLRF